MSRVRNFYVVIFVLLLLIIFNGCAAKPATVKKVNVSAAISLKTALEKVQKLYQQENPQVKISFNFASSGALQKQIAEGAPADLFISAGQKQMTELNNKKLIRAETLTNLLGNHMVLIVPLDNPSKIKSFNDLAKVNGNIAIGEPESVPAGTYARETLQKLGLWAGLKKQLIYTKDVSQVLTYVVSGNVQAGLVYNSDILNQQKIKVVAEAPDNTHQPIIYPAAVTTNAVETAETKKFLQYLQSAKIQKIFAQNGFSKP